MNYKSIYFFLLKTILFFSVLGCVPEVHDEKEIREEASVSIVKVNLEPTTNVSLIVPSGMTIESRFRSPVGFERRMLPTQSFAQYLRTLPLKPNGAKVKYYDGSEKNKANVYDAVVDLGIGRRDLHQCADAIMRLKAEYHWNQKEYDQIHFNFMNGFRVDYSEWMKGKRVLINGNKTSWSAPGNASNTYKDFWKYMEIIFSYAGTISLEKELKPVPISEMQIGDVFIQGGSPGHAVIVVDISINEGTGEKLFLLAQSYMPAQEIQILKNPNNSKISPWYSTNLSDVFETPEWNFRITDLKRF